ncbi:MAG: hypothetical protein RIT04_550 [Candidatus Parcubacteria bacterium]
MRYRHKMLTHQMPPKKLLPWKHHRIEELARFGKNVRMHKDDRECIIFFPQFLRKHQAGVSATVRGGTELNFDDSGGDRLHLQSQVGFCQVRGFKKSDVFAGQDSLDPIACSKATFRNKKFGDKHTLIRGLGVDEVSVIRSLYYKQTIVCQSSRFG